jgi:hypothetical protein
MMRNIQMVNRRSKASEGRPSSRRRTGIVTSVAAALAATFSVSAGAVPVVPGLVAPGSSTPAGRGGTIHRVTNLNESGPGSLRACVDASGPRVCVFEVSGVIRMSGDLIIRNRYITIAGQTAPSPGITLRGGGLRIITSDVLVQHIHVRPGDDPDGTPPDNRDALKIEQVASSPISNIVIDHCSFSWAIDETASAWENWDNIVLSNNIFAEPLHDSLHSKGAHGYGVLLGPVQGHATLVGNLFAHQAERNPLSSTARLVFVNNVIYNSGSAGMVLSTVGGYQTFNTVAGNVFLRGPNSGSARPIQIRANGTDALAPGSRVYLSDNDTEELAGDDAWSIVGPFADGGVVTVYRASSPPVWPANMLRLPARDDVTLNHVLRYAGARPVDRDPVDRRIVEQVRTRTGRIINCVAPNGTARCERNAGGWPNLPQNRRTLQIPGNPHQMTDSGYTNLELWLHRMAAEVEGRSSTPPAPPVLRN